MLFIIFVGLIAKLTSVSSDWDVGIKERNDFNWDKFSGPRPWYFLLHKSNEFENQIGCPVGIFASPQGNWSFVTANVYDWSKQRHAIAYGNATNWNSTGYFDLYHTVSIWTGRFHVLAVDYERYFIFKLHPFNANEATTLLDPIYVGYRTYRPDEKTVEEVKQKLQENNIDINQLMEWPVDHCLQEYCK